MTSITWRRIFVKVLSPKSPRRDWMARSRGLRGCRTQGKSDCRPKKGRAGRRRRLKGARGRGTLEKEKPPILGLIQRNGQVVLRMLPDVKQKTIKPIIDAVVAKGTMIYTDEYAIYTRLPVWGYQHNVTAGANMRATRTVMAFTRSTSTPWKASGHYCAPGCALIAASRRKNFLSTSASSSSFITPAREARHSWAPWLVHSSLDT
jgi:transposase-like protein